MARELIAKYQTMHHSSSLVYLRVPLQEHSEANGKWKDQFQDFDTPTPAENYWESMENQLSSRGTVCQDSHHCRFTKKIHEHREVCQTRPENFEDRIIFLSIFNDIDWTRKQILNNVFRENGQELGKKFPVCGHSSNQEKKKNGMECTWWTISQKVYVQYSEVPARRVEES